MGSGNERRRREAPWGCVVIKGQRESGCSCGTETDVVGGEVGRGTDAHGRAAGVGAVVVPRAAAQHTAWSG